MDFNILPCTGHLLCQQFGYSNLNSIMQTKASNENFNNYKDLGFDEGSKVGSVNLRLVNRNSTTS